MNTGNAPRPLRGDTKMLRGQGAQNMRIPARGGEGLVCDGPEEHRQLASAADSVSAHIR